MKTIPIKIMLIILFLGCLLKMPYGYFQIVRWIGMIGFVFLAINKPNHFLTFIWVASAILINPFYKISLGRDVWNIVDVVWVVILIISIFFKAKVHE